MGGADAAVESFYGFLLEWPSLYRAALAWHQVKPARLALEIIRLRKAKDQVGQAPIARLAPEIFENIYEQLLAMHIQEQPLELKDLLHQQEAEDNQSEDNQSSNGSPYIGVLNGKV